MPPAWNFLSLRRLPPVTADSAASKSIAKATATKAAPLKPVVSEAVKKRARNELLLKILAPLLGLALLLLIWEGISKGGATIPGPLATFKAAVIVLSDPFYQNGPNDQGIGFKVVNSLGRVCLGLWPGRRWSAFLRAS